MARRLVSVIVFTAFLTVTAGGCASQSAERHKGALGGGAAGAVAGGVVGGVIGHQSGHTTEGALLGVLVGGLAGAAIGHYAYDQKATEEQARTQYDYNYDETQANLVRLESVGVTPDRVRPGEKVELASTYTVLGPQGAKMNVTETREVRLNGELQGKPSVTVQRQGGTYQSSVPLILPSNAQKGDYVVETTVQSGGSTDTRESRFTVY